MTRRVKGEETPDLGTALKDMFASYYVTKNQVLAAFNLEHLKQAREFSLLHKRAENTKNLLKIVNYSEMDEESSTDEDEESSTDEDEESSTDEDEESSTDEDEESGADEKGEENKSDEESDEENKSDDEEVETEEEEQPQEENTTPTQEVPTTEETQQTPPPTPEETTPTPEETTPEETTTEETTTEETTPPTPEEETQQTPEETPPTTEEKTTEETTSTVEPSTVDSTGSIGPQSIGPQSIESQSIESQSIESQNIGNENENENEMKGGNTMEWLRKYVGRVFTCLIIGLLEQGPDFFVEIWQLPKKSDTGAINAILTSLFLDCVGEHHAMVTQDLAENTLNLFLMPAQSVYVNQKNLCAIAAYVLACACVQRKLLPQDMLQLAKSIQHMAIKEALEKILAPKTEMPLFLNESAKMVVQDKANIHVVTVQFLELLESKPMRMKDAELNMLNVPLKSAAPIRRRTRRLRVPAKKSQPKAKKNKNKK